MIWLSIMLIAVPMFVFIGAAIFEIHLARDPLPRAMSALAPRHHRDPSHDRARKGKGMEAKESGIAVHSPASIPLSTFH